MTISLDPGCGLTDESYCPPKTIVISARRAETLRREILRRVKVVDGHWTGLPAAYHAVKGGCVRTRRLIWVLFRDDAPMESFQVKTTCRFTHCLNPEHMNLADAMITSVHGEHYLEIVVKRVQAGPKSNGRARPEGTHNGHPPQVRPDR